MISGLFSLIYAVLQVTLINDICKFPDTVFLAIVAAPTAFFIWVWRDMDRQRQLEIDSAVAQINEMKVKEELARANREDFFYTIGELMERENSDSKKRNAVIKLERFLYDSAVDTNYRERILQTFNEIISAWNSPFIKKIEEYTYKYYDSKNIAQIEKIRKDAIDAMPTYIKYIHEILIECISKHRNIFASHFEARHFLGMNFCNFQNRTFSKVDFSKVDFSFSNLWGCCFDNCNLTSVTFCGCELFGVKIKNCCIDDFAITRSHGRELFIMNSFSDATDANVDTRVSFEGSDLNNSIFATTKITNASFINNMMLEANFKLVSKIKFSLFANNIYNRNPVTIDGKSLPHEHNIYHPIFEPTVFPSPYKDSITGGFIEFEDYLKRKNDGSLDLTAVIAKPDLTGRRYYAADKVIEFDKQGHCVVQTT